MKKTSCKLLAISTLLMLGASAQVALAQDTAPTSPAPKMQDRKEGVILLSVQGEVVDVNQDTRSMAIKNAEGGIFAFSVGPEVKNFSQVKVGDRMVVDYSVSVATALVKGGDGIREKIESDTEKNAKRGAKPGATEVKRVTILANVLTVDHKKKMARLQGPEGRVVDVRVTDPKMMKAIKTGDQVVATITESMVVAIRPASPN